MLMSTLNFGISSSSQDDLSPSLEAVAALARFHQLHTPPTSSTATGGQAPLPSHALQASVVDVHIVNITPFPFIHLIWHAVAEAGCIAFAKLAISLGGWCKQRMPRLCLLP